MSDPYKAKLQAALAAHTERMAKSPPQPGTTQDQTDRRACGERLRAVVRPVLDATMSELKAVGHEAAVREHTERDALITMPSYKGRRGHPPLLDASLIPEMREVSEATQGLRAVIQRHEEQVADVEFDTPVVLLDLNRPEEYAEARATYFERAAR